ncbi:VanZ family protein [Adhaeribacter pallidiroseus]|uniref:VanZ family protein n=1 Tax=Adhaeribacter pallidiroseus TaxID=2072847 RepID=UPI0011C049ED|nr:VanZ family protein [Adhaeribacter pallidiroseus]
MLPPQALPKVPDWSLTSIHSLAHLFIFMTWAFLLLTGFFRAATSGKYNRIWVTFILAVSYGALIEVLQGLMRLGRQPDIVDIFFNTLGALLGIAAFFLVKKFFVKEPLRAAK